MATKQHFKDQIMLDEQDKHLLDEKTWCIHKSKGKSYVKKTEWIKGSGGKYKTLRLHRIIMDAPDNMEVDHINGNGLDNRRENLRLCTRKQNIYNKKIDSKRGYKGICKYFNKWRSQISKDGKKYYLGLFSTKREAMNAYDKKAIELHGEFACLNNIN